MSITLRLPKSPRGYWQLCAALSYTILRYVAATTDIKQITKYCYHVIRHAPTIPTQTPRCPEINAKQLQLRKKTALRKQTYCTPIRKLFPQFLATTAETIIQLKTPPKRCAYGNKRLMQLNDILASPPASSPRTHHDPPRYPKELQCARLNCILICRMLRTRTACKPTSMDVAGDNAW